MWFWFSSTIKKLLDSLIDRVIFNYEMWKWEKDKRSEGFPKEWFEEE